MKHTRPIAHPLDGAVSRRGLLVLLGTAAAVAWSAHTAFGQIELDEYGHANRVPGETPTGEATAREREATQQSIDRAIQDRAEQPTEVEQQRFQHDTTAAQRHELEVQQSIQQHQLDSFDNRDTP